MTGDVTPIQPTWQEMLQDVEAVGDIAMLKTQLSMEWVLEQYGVHLGAQGRTACISPAHESPDPNFAVWVSDDGTQAGYCFACGFHADVFKVIMQFEDVQFSRARARASKLLVKYRKAAESGWTPTVVHQERVEPDTHTLGLLLQQAQAHARANPYILHELIAQKSVDNPSWRNLTPGFLMDEWGLGSSDTTTYRRVAVSNPDSAPYPHTTRAVQYQRVVIPYFLRLEDGSLQVRALKDRTRYRTGNGQVWGDWLPFGKPIWRPGPDTSILYGSWRIRGERGNGDVPTV